MAVVCGDSQGSAQAPRAMRSLPRLRWGARSYGTGRLPGVGRALFGSWFLKQLDQANDCHNDKGQKPLGDEGDPSIIRRGQNKNPDGAENKNKQRSPATEWILIEGGAPSF
jgi:hypothetical protein